MTIVERPRFVYVSGPYSVGSQVENVRAAILAAEQIRNVGHYAFVPHLWYHWDLISPRGWDDWMEQSLAWISRCDVLVRLPGTSPGSDREVLLARERGMPVYLGIEEFLNGGS